MYILSKYINRMDGALMSARKSFTPIITTVACPTGAIKYELQECRAGSVMGCHMWQKPGGLKYFMVYVAYICSSDTLALSGSLVRFFLQINQKVLSVRIHPFSPTFPLISLTPCARVSPCAP